MGTSPISSLSPSAAVLPSSEKDKGQAEPWPEKSIGDPAIDPPFLTLGARWDDSNLISST